MKRGEPIMRLSNTDLQLGIVTQQTNVYNLLAQLQISKNAAEQNTVTKLNQMTDVESQLKEAERIYILDKGLYDQKVIGLQEFKKSENDYNYYLKKKKLTGPLQQDSVSNAQQVSQAKQSYEGSQNALNVMRQKAGDLYCSCPG